MAIGYTIFLIRIGWDCGHLRFGKLPCPHIRKNAICNPSPRFGPLTLAHLAPLFLAPACPDRGFVYTLRKAVFVCFLRERRSARNRSPSLLHLKSGKNVNFSLPIRLERGIVNGNLIYGFPYSDMIRLRSFTP